MARAGKGMKGFSGTIGNLVFYERNGITYVRTRPARYKDAKSESQLLTRGRFAGCNSFYNNMKDKTLRQIWKTIAEGTGKNGKNLFMQHNIHAFGKDMRIADFSRLHFSTGFLPLPNVLHLVCFNNHDCQLEWDYDPSKGYGSLYGRRAPLLIPQ